MIRLHLYNAAGNRILWIDGGNSNDEDHFDRLKIAGARLARRCQFGQEMTAVLFGSSRGWRALFWNPDGTEEKICGNAIRCSTHFISSDSAPINKVSIETLQGNYLGCKLSANQGSVFMPGNTIRIADTKINGDVLVDVGTPHLVRVVEREWPDEDVKEAVACSAGANPVNFDLVRRINSFHFRTRIFERGAGETASCGTGAVAIVKALGKFGAGSIDPEQTHLVQFASGEELTVTYDRTLDSFEVGGRVELLKASSIPHLNPA